MTRSIATRYEVPVFATVLGGYAFLSGFASFLGWPLDIPRLTDWFNDDVSIQPNAAMLIMFSGAAIMLVERRAWRGVITLGVLVGVGGMAIMLQYLVGADFGFNHQLLFGRTWGQITTITPGGVGPPASASLALIGTALVLLGGAGIRPGLSRLRRFVPSIGIAVSTIMGFSLLGYLFGAREFYTIPSLTAIAFPTASMLLATGVALIASVPERDPMLLFRERSGVGVLARTTILALAIMIPLVLWLRVKGFEYGYYDTGMGRALGALILIIGTIVVVWTALMALRRHEHELREVGRRKDEFLATLAHELRNPLAPLTNALAILDASEGNQAIGRKTRKIMSRQLKHMVRLIDDLIDVSRISRGAVEIRKERLELNDVLQETVEAMRPICEESQQELCVERSPQPVWIEADRVRIAQIVSNLISNASRYSRIGMPIEVHVSSEGRDVVLSVKDRGIGIPSEKQDTIFEMFSRGDTALEDHSGGLGIGLYLSRRLAEIHGGTVTALSDGLDRGSEFILRLPVVSEAPNNVDSMALQRRLIRQLPACASSWLTITETRPSRWQSCFTPADIWPRRFTMVRKLWRLPRVSSRMLSCWISGYPG